MSSTRAQWIVLNGVNWFGIQIPVAHLIWLSCSFGLKPTYILVQFVTRFIKGKFTEISYRPIKRWWVSKTCLFESNDFTAPCLLALLSYFGWLYWLQPLARVCQERGRCWLRLEMWRGIMRRTTGWTTWATTTGRYSIRRQQAIIVVPIGGLFRGSKGKQNASSELLDS